jgi:quinate/shikimate dehydrogenase (NAD+)
MSEEHTLHLGLVGAGIGGSLSKPMHEQEGRACGIPLSYRAIDAEQLGFGVEDLPEVLAWAERLGFDGLNVTHPFKQAVVPLLDERSEAVEALGAANTVVIRDGRTVGYNTDWSGFARSLERTLPGRSGDRVVLVGAGGAGVAVGYALLQLGIRHLDVHDTDPARAEACVARLARTFDARRLAVVEDLAAALAAADGLVHATPTGMHGHPGLPLPAELVRPDLWVADIVYFPLDTELVQLAAERGCRVVPGGGMAVFQAVGAFELFTGRTPDADRMLAHFAELTSSSLSRG